MAARVAAVLFDLDGTLIDSAPDLAGAANELRRERGMPAMPYAALRPLVGSGARGMVGAALGLKPGDPGYDAARDEFLRCYERRMLVETTVFPAVLALLPRLAGLGVPWGIVTNKALRLAEPVATGLALMAQAAVLIGGDSTPHSKPHPAPLLAAAERMNVAPEQCVYVGDDLRDVQAGRAAGMATLAAAWGYLGDGESVHAWGADAVIAQPLDLLQWLEVA